MRTYVWVMSFLGIAFFILNLAGKFQNYVNIQAPAEKKNLEYINIAPVCLDRSYIPDEEAHWLYMPNDSSELATSENYGYLSGQIIMAGGVDASDCPLNGLWPNGYANACGLEKTRETSLYLQNVYDDEILAAGKGLGVPPVMVKQLIRYESQFWPGQMGAYHFGLSHLTSIGATAALTWSRSLYGDVYKQLQPQNPKVTSDMMTSQLIFTVDATCQSCPLKINVQKAEESIIYIAEVLLAYCRQTTQVVYNATNKRADGIVDYSTIWKLTLLNYNAGPICVYNSVGKSYKSGDDDFGKLNWDAVADNLDEDTCFRGLQYVENITAKYYDFTIEP